MGGTGVSPSDGSQSSDDDPFSQVFDEAFVAGGVREDSLRRHQVRPGPPPSSRPRDWTPSPVPGRRRRRRWTLLVVVLLLGLGSVVAFYHPDNRTAPIPDVSAHSGATPTGLPEVKGLAPDTAVGTCFDQPVGQVVTVVFRSCAVPHGYEEVKVEQATGPDGGLPGDDYWSGPVAQRCYQDLLHYVGLPRARWPKYLYSTLLRPTAEAWASGDRTVHCLAGLKPAHAGSVSHLAPAAGDRATSPT